ncbi:MAG TPA: DUF2804 family protein, partial [Thermoleophilaceae bacterium]|nr:DUF2804 family protein [Thermoleophilaceae bacterium]
PGLMLCAGEARIGPLPQRWWAVCERDRPLRGRTAIGSAGLRSVSPDPSDARGGTRLWFRENGLEVDLALATQRGPRPIEVVSPSGDQWVWTRKQVGVPASGTVSLRGLVRVVGLEASIDDSAGYHERRTRWRWSTGVGRAESGERIGWNVVAGIHDGPGASERTLWVDGEPAELGPVEFAEDLSRVDLPGGGRLDFSQWAVREHRTNLLVVRSAYRQPFGTFTGELPGGLRLTEGYGVMEEHDVRW